MSKRLLGEVRLPAMTRGGRLVHRRLSATDRAETASRFLPPMTLFAYYRKSDVPEGGWTNENYTGDAREELRQDLLMARREVLLRGMRTLAPALAKLMEEQIEAVVRIALEGFARLYGIPVKSIGAKADVTFNVPNHAGMWADAIEQEMARAGHQVTTLMAPAIETVSAASFSKVMLLLGTTATASQISAVGAGARQIAANVSNVSDTVRRKLHDTISMAIREGKTVFQTAELVRKRIPEIATSRVPTIVRTELGNAADAATKYGMRVGGVVTHIDVIGCETVELNGPKYKGVPTCNISGVPITDEKYLKFHPNHTGAIVPGAFRQSDGSIPQVQLRMGTGTGVPLGG